MKLWQKDINTAEKVERFTVGNDRTLDLALARYDVQGSLAHTAMLCQQGFLNPQERDAIHQELHKILQQIEEGAFSIEEGVEDIHSQVELQLTRTLGDIGKKIHTGRSRNDQVLVDLMLFMRSEIGELCQHVEVLFAQLIQLSEMHKDALMPGYTHMQVAMPSSFGLWFGAYAETLVDDVHLFAAAHRIVNQNPLGSAAGYGSSFPLDRTFTTTYLKFDTLKYNAAAAQLARGKAEQALAFAMGATATTLSKLAMDVCLYMGQNFGFISFPDELTTGSSIMPHKKNPDVFELIRARANQMQALPTQIGMIINNLPLGYHRDFQQLKELLFPAIEQLKDLLDMTTFMLAHVRVHPDCIHETRYDYLYTVEEVNREVIAGVPFRDAYKRVAQRIAAGTYQPVRTVQHTHEGSIGNLCNHAIQEKMQKALSFLKDADQTRENR